MFGLSREFRVQLARIKVVAHTDRGKLVVTDGKPRIFWKTWGKAVIGFHDEPWELSAGIRTAIILDIERLFGRMRSSDGTELTLPNLWIVGVSLSGWYQQDVYIDGKLVMSKPQVSLWERLGEVQPGYCLFNLGEHEDFDLPWYVRLRWTLKWGIEAYAAHLPPLSQFLERRGWVEMILGIRRWDDRYQPNLTSPQNHGRCTSTS